MTCTRKNEENARIEESRTGAKMKEEVEREEGP
jgi:hypothetical protein